MFTHQNLRKIEEQIKLAEMRLESHKLDYVRYLKKLQDESKTMLRNWEVGEMVNDSLADFAAQSAGKVVEALADMRRQGYQISLLKSLLTEDEE